MIDVRDLSRSFGRTAALDHISFRVEPGEIVALLGPNGAGKTTASRIIAGILAPSEGDVLVDGISVRADPHSVRQRCGMVTDHLVRSGVMGNGARPICGMPASAR